jgi:hypothetical protein
MLETFLFGLCLRDLDTTHLPFAAGIGVKVCTSDPAFMRRQQLPPRPDERPTFPFDMDAFMSRRSRSESGLGGCKKLTRACSACGWMTSSRSCAPTGTAPTYSRAFQTVDKARVAMDAHWQVDDIVVSNHCGCSWTQASEGARGHCMADPAYFSLSDKWMARR